ncbi:substrate-binding domain-containing protein [Balneatrix alpica]|uniref:substrate-binding domain-containing protein n=1 Tax=Balneatrix alpica TaxID=75684 RepID=UPI0027397AD7|nr:substrate-binding domain-containing protein [Balneatrix alpica]
MLRLLTCALCCLSWIGLATASPSAEHLSPDEYYQAHPEQQALSQALAAEVRANPVPLAKQPAEAIRISVIYPGLQASDYWRRNLAAFEQRLQALQLPYELEVFNSSPSESGHQEAEFFSRTLAKRPHYLITTLDTPSQKRMIEFVLARGSTQVILQNITTPLKVWQERSPLIYVGFDHAQGTRMLADYFSQHFQQKAQYGLLYWSPGYVSEARGDSFIRYMAEFPQVKLTQAYYTDANRQSSYTAAKKLLAESPDLSFIYACATDVALGALDALQEAGRLGQVQVNGWGGGAAELEAISQGRLDVTVMRMNDDTGVAMAEAIRRDISGQPVPRIYSGDFELVTRQTSADKIQALKEHAFRYSGMN